MKRREFIALLGGAATWPLAARAQQSGEFPVSDSSEIQLRRSRPISPGRSARVARAWLGGRPKHRHRVSLGGRKLCAIPGLVAELLASKVDVIVTAGTPASLAVKKVTTWCPLS